MAGARTSVPARVRRVCISPCGRTRRSVGGASTPTTTSATPSIPTAPRPTCAPEASSSPLSHSRRWITGVWRGRRARARGARRCARDPRGRRADDRSARRGRPRPLLPGAPELLREPVETQVLQRLRQGLAGLPVVADFPVPGVDHLLPLCPDRLPGRGAVVRRGAVAVRRLFEIGREPAAQRRRAVDGGGAPAEAHRLGHRVVPARRRRQRAADVLEARARREDADAQRVFERAAAPAARHELGDVHAVERVDARGQPELRLVDGVARLHRRGRRRRGVEHLLPARAVVVAARRGALARVDRGLRRLAAELLGGALDALGEQVAESLAPADHLQQPVGAGDVAPLEIEPHLLLREPALLEALHHPADHPAELVDVHARAVGLRVEPGHGALVGGADRPARARPALVLRLVDGLALVRPLPDDRHVAVVHAARVALVPAMVEALAQPRRLPRLHVHVAGDARRVVPDRQRPHLREVHDAGQRAVLVERARRGIGLEVVRDVVGGLDDPARVRSAQRLGAPHDRDGLQLLLAHDRADAVLGRNVAVVTLDGGPTHEMLAGGTDRVDRELVSRHAEVAAQRVLRLPRVLPEVRLGVADLDAVVVDVEVDPVSGLSLDDDGVVAGVLQIRPEEAVGLRRGRAVGERADRDDGETARAPHGQTGEGARAEHEAVVGVVPRDVSLSLPRLAVEDHGAEPGAADQVTHLVGLPRLAPRLSLREVHTQDLAGVAAGQRGLGLADLLGSAQGHRAHTATGVSPGAFDGRPSTVSGRSAPVVPDAMYAVFTSNGCAFRWSLNRPSDTPVCTRPFSMPTSFVVHTSPERPMMMAPVRRSPVKRYLRYAERSRLAPTSVSAFASSQAPNDAASRWQTSTMLMMSEPLYATSLPAMLAPTTRPCSCAV